MTTANIPAATASKLESALKRLTTALHTPVVAGELEPWLVAVREAARAVDESLRHEIEAVHPGEYALIAAEDPELFRQVEQMKSGDRHTLEQLDEFAGRIKELLRAAPHCEPDEARLQESLKTFMDAGLGLVMHAQKQEVARRTWLLEAFNRERGVGD